MKNDADGATIIASLTYNGAANLKGTIEKPHHDHPDLVNGGSRLWTGLGKWTTLAAIGVENHLISLKLAEWRYIDWNKDGRGWASLVVTPVGREVAERVTAHWSELDFRDGRAGARQKTSRFNSVSSTSKKRQSQSGN